MRRIDERCLIRRRLALPARTELPLTARCNRLMTGAIKSETTVVKFRPSSEHACLCGLGVAWRLGEKPNGYFTPRAAKLAKLMLGRLLTQVQPLLI